MAKKVTLKIDPGMWSNLTDEFGTDDPYQLITELVEARSMLLADNTDLRDETGGLEYGLDYLLDVVEMAHRSLALSRTSGRETQAREAQENAESLLYKTLQTIHNDGKRGIARKMQQELADLRADMAQVEEASAFLGEAAGTAAAERDRALAELEASEQEHAHSTRIGLHLIRANLRLKRAALRLYHGSLWAAAWKRAAKYAWRWWKAEEACGDQYYAANQRLKRACLAWWQAAHEAQEAQFRYRDADVEALVGAAEAVSDGAVLVDGEPEFELDPEDLACLDGALRPFRKFKVPLFGEIGETPEEWEALRARVMTAEDIDAARPGQMEVGSDE